MLQEQYQLAPLYLSTGSFPLGTLRAQWLFTFGITTTLMSELMGDVLPMELY